MGTDSEELQAACLSKHNATYDNTCGRWLYTDRVEVLLVQRSLLLPDDAVTLSLLEDHLAVLEEVASDDEQFLSTLHTAPVHGRLAHLWLARRLGYNHSTT